MEKKTMGSFLAALRRANGMTQKELAERLNVSDKSVSRWERDDGAPDLALIPVIAEVFGVTCDELLRGERAAAGEEQGAQSTPKGEQQKKHQMCIRDREKGSAEAIHQKWKEICVDSLVNPKTKWRYADVCRGIVADFDALPIDETLRKPCVGIVGEILVKYMPLANNHLVELLEAEGAEAVVPDLLDFFNYSIYGRDFRHKNLGTSWKDSVVAKAGVEMLRRLRAPALEALEKSRRFEAPMPIEDVAKLAEPFLAIGNQYGEGWFLTGEMAELLTSGTPNIVCIQPFACLPNHVVGKGVIKALRKSYPRCV